MVKVTYIPKGTNSQLWMGNADLHDYTVQADLKGVTVGGKLPDMGVIAQRYTLVMLGDRQSLQIRSWPPQATTHLAKTVPFEWKADVWYTVKLPADTESSADGNVQYCEARLGLATKKNRHNGRLRQRMKRPIL